MTVTERFMRYVTFPTQSDESSNSVPSTAGQKVLGEQLVNELKVLGVDAYMDDKGYVYGTLPATSGYEDEPVIGLIAHMDTSDAASGDNIKARIVENYDGGDIVLNNDPHIVMSPVEYPYLKDCKGMDIIVTDGTTLLGADNKAGIAEIITVLQTLIENSEIPHGVIKVGFTPDEEIGRGADHFDVAGFGADFAFTVDGGPIGEIEYENFNAASAQVVINGVSIHPGTAKNRMKNACLIAGEWMSMMPPAETPGHTEGYEGFYHLVQMEGREEKAILRYIIRDHDMQKFNQRKDFMNRIADYLNSKYGIGTVELTIEDSYYNMREKIEPVMHIIDRAVSAMKKEGIEPMIVPIRGGTDGARLSYEGLPCPNLSTGGYNFHSRFEFIPIQSMEKMVDVLVELVSAKD
ncbi:MAG: peptidase T [Clostridiales bacterium]|jgi:tripeptide aminopeptidase|nr:peptidase T [Clostridiales bacterium]